MHRSLQLLTLASLSLAVTMAGTALAQDKPESPTKAPQIDIPESKPDTPQAKIPKKPKTPLDLVMKDGIPTHASKRAILRDDLYALLASASTPKEAKKIAAQIERVWRTSGSDTVSVLMRRTSRALKRKDQKLALTLLDAIVELAPDNAEAWNRRAFIHYSTKNYRAAVGDLRRALALDKNHYKALDGLASIFQQIGDDAKALKVYEQLREIHPHRPGLDKTYETLKGKVQGRGI